MNQQQQIKALARLMVVCQTCAHISEGWHNGCPDCHGDREVPRYSGLTEECPCDGKVYDTGSDDISFDCETCAESASGTDYEGPHDPDCSRCDGSSRRTIRDAMVAAMVVLEVLQGINVDTILAAAMAEAGLLCETCGGSGKAGDRRDGDPRYETADCGDCDKGIRKEMTS